jgi:hypothetical protein
MPARSAEASNYTKVTLDKSAKAQYAAYEITDVKKKNPPWRVFNKKQHATVGVLSLPAPDSIRGRSISTSRLNSVHQCFKYYQLANCSSPLSTSFDGQVTDRKNFLLYYFFCTFYQPKQECSTPAYENNTTSFYFFRFLRQCQQSVI